MHVVSIKLTYHHQWQSCHDTLYYKLELSGYLIDHNCVFSVVSQKDTMLTVNSSVFTDAMAYIAH